MAPSDLSILLSSLSSSTRRRLKISCWTHSVLSRGLRLSPSAAALSGLNDASADSDSRPSMRRRHVPAAARGIKFRSQHSNSTSPSAVASEDDHRGMAGRGRGSRKRLSLAKPDSSGRKVTPSHSSVQLPPRFPVTFLTFTGNCVTTLRRPRANPQQQPRGECASTPRERDRLRNARAVHGIVPGPSPASPSTSHVLCCPHALAPDAEQERAASGWADLGPAGGSRACGGHRVTAWRGGHAPAGGHRVTAWRGRRGSRQRCLACASRPGPWLSPRPVHPPPPSDLCCVFVY